MNYNVFYSLFYEYLVNLFIFLNKRFCMSYKNSLNTKNLSSKKYLRAEVFGA